MSEVQLSNSRKRQRTEQHQLPSPPLSKRQKKLHQPSLGYIEPSAFWDSLSKIWLTKHALKELNRRNTLLRSPNHLVHRPVTRNFLAELRNARQRTAADFLSNYRPSRVKDIKFFARRGGPDLSDLIGYPEPIQGLDHTMSSSSSNSRRQKRSSTSTSKSRRTTSNTTVTKDTGRSGPYTRNFQQNNYDTGVYQYGDERPDGSEPPLPPEWESFNRSVAQHRPSLSPSTFSDGGRREFVRRDAKAYDETDVTGKVIPAMLRAIGVSEEAQENKLFTDMEPLTDSNTRAQPDYYYGARHGQLDPRVRRKLHKHIVPQQGLPIAPNFFLEAKGPSGSGAVAVRQACHDGAIGARAMQSLRSYGQDNPMYDNSISAVSATYQLGQLKLYGHSVAQPNGPGTRPEYYMHQLDGWSMTGNKETFLKGATAFKNALDLTAEYRNTAIAHANEIAQTVEEEDDDDDYEVEAESSNTMHSFDCGTSQIIGTLAEDEDEYEDETEPSIDELAIYMPPPTKRSLPKSHRSHRQKRKTGQHSND